MLEVASLLCLVQPALLTHGVFLAVPAALLLAAAPFWHWDHLGALVDTPMLLVWPHKYSKLGLAHGQRSATKFYIFTGLIRMTCAASFWWIFLEWQQEGSFLEFSPDWCTSFQGLSDRDLRYFDEDFRYLGRSRKNFIDFFASRNCGDCVDQVVWAPTEEVCEQKWRGEITALARDPDQHAFDKKRKEVCHWVERPEANTSRGCFELMRFSWANWGPVDFCKRCAVRCNCNSLPGSLQAACWNGAGHSETLLFFHENVARGLSPSFLQPFTLSSWAFYDHLVSTPWTERNRLMARFHACVMRRQLHGYDDAWKATVLGLLYLPAVCLLLWLLMHVALPALLGLGMPCMPGSMPYDAARLQAVAAQANAKSKAMRRGAIPATFGDKLRLYMELVIFLMDYFSDLNLLVQLAVERQIALAVAQAVIILLPMFLDWCKGKVQLVEVVGGFLESRVKGFPNNKFLRALRSEKGVEAPLSLALQYYTVLRVASPRVFYSMLASILLSILSISNFAYATFELRLLDLLDAQIRIQLQEMADPELPQSSAGPTASMPGPHRPPGLEPPRPAQTAQIYPVVPPGLGLPPISLGHERFKDKE